MLSGIGGATMDTELTLGEVFIRRSVGGDDKIQQAKAEEKHLQQTHK